MVRVGMNAELRWRERARPPLTPPRPVHNRGYRSQRLLAYHPPAARDTETGIVQRRTISPLWSRASSTRRTRTG